MFGELIGLWCADFWQRMGAPDPVLLVELGPGRGTLMADALRAARRVPDFLAALRLHLVEHSPVLRATQAAKRSRRTRRNWHDTHRDACRPARCLLIANEFLDALPIRQFERGRPAGTSAGRARQRRRLAFVDPLPQPSARRRQSADGAPWRGRRELAAAAIALGARARARASRGTAARRCSSITATARAPAATRCRRCARIGRMPILDEPGDADLTAHVDFAAFAAAAARRAARRAWPGDARRGSSTRSASRRASRAAQARRRPSSRSRSAAAVAA